MPGRASTNIVEREVYEGRALPIPELDMFGWTSTAAAGHLGLSGHSHPSAYEICLIAAGHVTWWVGRQAFQLGPGSIYITKPGEVHGGSDDVLQPCALYWLQIELRSTRTLAGLTSRQSRAMSRAFATMSHRRFPASENLTALYQRLHAELRDRPMHWQAAARAAVRALLVQVLRDHEEAIRCDRTLGQPSKSIRDATAIIESHLADNLPVAELARRVGLGVSRFHERFAAEVGFSPADYRLHLRIRRAKQWLAHPSQPITSIAHALGFSSSQHFATTFKRLVGHTPTAYRARQRDAASS